MNAKIQKVLLSTVVAAGLGTVAVGGTHAFAAENKSNHDKIKDRAEAISDNAAFLAAQEAQFNALFGTKEDTTTKEEAAAPTETTAPTKTDAKQDIVVVVPQGASLTEIAAQYGITVDQLVAANNLLPAGYQLTVPQK
ncbi:MULTISPECIES: LysM peptidoglycan-binding domain-containing protein [Paenibacillus]|uniref:LysM peptidoglycan-binding domain-containing protein n=1 Tax=Paenibacillus TaxID=44249 RepID=UPI00037BD0C4|nr:MULTISPECIES: LysM peptidoglycan-binding domain-containing protein [Paenibacillus]